MSRTAHRGQCNLFSRLLLWCGCFGFCLAFRFLSSHRTNPLLPCRRSEHVIDSGGLRASSGARQFHSRDGQVLIVRDVGGMGSHQLAVDVELHRGVAQHMDTQLDVSVVG